ncbi:MAG: cysteine--tRNA ligase [Chloroflexi bacterium]|nr:cysteine--tRNA ligase [Chloroflexota bacterium]
MPAPRSAQRRAGRYAEIVTLPTAPRELELTDTRRRARVPLPEGALSVYVCGVTPYDTTHLGHAFTFVQFDTLVRALRWLGREVTYVQNVTDIDDSILARARRQGEDWQALGRRETVRYLEDMRTLNVAAPDHFVAATSVIPEIRSMVERLLELGAAYATDGGSVFFRIAASPHYGELSRLDRPGMLEIAASQDDADVDDPRKEDPLDFALWKGWSGSSDEPAWPSPWGPGRPAWHIECSAICKRYLGPQVSVHGGGADLVYPHHESEIAQSELATGRRPFVHAWLHTGMTRMDGVKMSKSLGNLVFVRDLVREHSGDAVRLYLLEHRYGDAFDWRPADLESAARRMSRLRVAAAEADRDDGARERFVAALADDLNTPAALRALDGAGGSTVRELAGVLGLTLSGADLAYPPRMTDDDAKATGTDKDQPSLKPDESWGQGTDSTHPQSATGQPVERVDEATADDIGPLGRDELPQTPTRDEKNS